MTPGAVMPESAHVVPDVLERAADEEPPIVVRLAETDETLLLASVTVQVRVVEVEPSLMMDVGENEHVEIAGAGSLIVIVAEESVRLDVVSMAETGMVSEPVAEVVAALMAVRR